MVNKRVQIAVLGCNLKNDRMISVCFQGKPFNIMVIKVYAPTSDAEEAERLYEDLQDLLELTPPKICPFHYRGLECKSRKSRNTWSSRQIWPWSSEWSSKEKKSEIAQACPTVCDPLDCSLPGSSVLGIFKARILEWVCISFSKGSSQLGAWTHVSCVSFIGKWFLY